MHRSLPPSVRERGNSRFRAITLTSITTFAGVLPILFETSLQAKFVVPMAAALGSAVLYATLVTLLLVPCLYLILQDLTTLFGKFFGLFPLLKNKLTGKSPQLS